MPFPKIEIKILAKRIKNYPKIRVLTIAGKKPFFIFGWKGWKKDYPVSTFAKCSEKLTFLTS